MVRTSIQANIGQKHRLVHKVGNVSKIDLVNATTEEKIDYFDKIASNYFERVFGKSNRAKRTYTQTEIPARNRNKRTLANYSQVIFKVTTSRLRGSDKVSQVNTDHGSFKRYNSPPQIVTPNEILQEEKTDLSFGVKKRNADYFLQDNAEILVKNSGFLLS